LHLIKLIWEFLNTAEKACILNYPFKVKQMQAFSAFRGGTWNFGENLLLIIRNDVQSVAPNKLIWESLNTAEKACKLNYPFKIKQMQAFSAFRGGT
jgi:hypothetical protein